MSVKSTQRFSPRAFLRAHLRTFALLFCALAISGCSSIAKGVTQAILDTDDQIEDRLCRIDGEGFDGLQTSINAATPPDNVQTMRMLIVHGIGPHSENYSEPFVRSIAQGLGLKNRNREQKRIRLSKAQTVSFGTYSIGALGWLNITRYTNDAGTKELLAFEVLWSDYNEPARKKILNFDKDTARLRASVNNTVKTFFNQQVIDPVKYLGDNATDVRAHVRQASCWMLSGDWESYPAQSLDDKEVKVCPLIHSLESVSGPAGAKARDIAGNDSFVAVTHSLGSRIFLDAFSIQGDERDSQVNPFSVIGGYLINRDVTVIMLANQLPLLQEGLNDEAGFGYPGVPWKNSERYNGAYSRVTDEVGFAHYETMEALCADPNLLKSQRRFQKMSLVSVSDPNDLLSYRLLVGDFVDDYVDWALCPSVTEVLISVTPPRSLFGLDFADPSAAHGNYWTDPGLAHILLSGFDGDNGKMKFSTDPQGEVLDADSEKAKIRYNCEGMQLH